MKLVLCPDCQEHFEEADLMGHIFASHFQGGYYAGFGDREFYCWCGHLFGIYQIPITQYLPFAIHAFHKHLDTCGDSIEQHFVIAKVMEKPRPEHIRPMWSSFASTMSPPPFHVLSPLSAATSMPGNNLNHSGPTP